MANPPINNFKILSVREIFYDSVFSIPSYQRDYTWEKNQIEDLCIDLMNIVQSPGDDYHFFGQIVTFEKANSYGEEEEVIDGQQRLTTSQLFLAAIYHKAKSLKPLLNESESDLSHDISKIENNIEDLVGKVSLTKSLSEENDDKVFKSILNNGSYLGDEPLSIISKRLLDNYNQISRWLSIQIKDNDSFKGISKFKKIANNFTDRFYFTKMSTTKPKDAFTIFQTLNSRGSVLESADVIKSYLLSLLNDDYDLSKKANDQWNKISKTLGTSKKITTFIRTYWSAAHQSVGDQVLYRNFSKEIQSPKEAQETLSELVSLIPIYAYMINASQRTLSAEYRHKYSNLPSDQFFVIADRVGFKVYYPIILAMTYKEFPEQSIRTVMYKIINIFAVHILILGRRSNTIDSVVSGISHDIWHGNLKTTDEINGRLKKIIDNESDEENLRGNLSALSKKGSYQGANKFVISYLFTYFYHRDFKGWNNAYESIMKEDKYSIMQIGTFNEIAEEFLGKIGNWTIIEKGLSSKISNKSLDDTINILEQSNLESNQEIANLLDQRKKQGAQQWTLSDVLNRQQKLSNEYATQIGTSPDYI